MIAEILPYNKSALCRSACPALSFVLLQFVYVLVCQGHDDKTSRVGKVPAAIQSHTCGVFRCVHVTPLGLPLKRLENAHCQSYEHTKNADDNHGDVKSLQGTFGLLFFVFLFYLLAGEDFRKCLRQKENKKVTIERSESCLCLDIMKLLSVGTNLDPD